MGMLFWIVVGIGLGSVARWVLPGPSLLVLFSDRSFAMRLAA